MPQITPFRTPTRIAVLAGTLATVAALPAPAYASEGRENTVALTRGSSYELPVHVRRGGEGLFSFRPSSRTADWGRQGSESGVVEASIDGVHVTDIVVLGGDQGVRSVALGHLPTGDHTLRLRFDERSPAGVQDVLLERLRVDVERENADDYALLDHAPVVVGRDLVFDGLGGPRQNSVTDTPLVGWHEELPAATPGHVIEEYSVIWSNEDGGTNTPALMARWGRTTDIEWIYRVELDEHGQRVPGSDTYQAPEHATLQFTGQYLGGHPVLQTCTWNNNMCDAVTAAPADRMLFRLDYRATRPADRSRELIMDQNPWTYAVTAQEAVREGRIESPSDPATPEVGDERTYLFIETTHAVGPVVGAGDYPAIALTVKLKDSDTVYRSDHGTVGWGVQRTVPASSTVELPEGTTPQDIEWIGAERVAYAATDNGAPVTVTAIGRAFFLGQDYLPQQSFVQGPVDVELTTSDSSAEIWHS